MSSLGLFQSYPSEQSLSTTHVDAEDPSAVFANMFFGASLPSTPSDSVHQVARAPTPSESPHQVPEPAAPSVVERSVPDFAEAAPAISIPQRAVTISPVKFTEDELFNCPSEDMYQSLSTDPVTLHQNSLGDGANESEMLHSTHQSDLDLEQAAERPSENEPEAQENILQEASKQDASKYDSLVKQASQQSDLSSRTGSEKGSRRSLRHVSKLPQEVSMRASKVVKDSSGKMKKAVVDGSGQVKRVVKDGSHQALKASTYVVKESSGKVKKVVVDGSGQVTRVVKDGSHQVTKVVKDGSQQVTKRINQVNPENLKRATDYGVKGVKKATGAGVSTIVKAKDMSVDNVKNLASYVLGSGDGTPLDAGFVVFSKLSTTHAALQMIHHPHPFVMDVQEAPMPEDVYWKNVGMPHKARQMGKLISLGLTGLLCLTWTVPVSFISSLTEVDSLREAVPFIDKMLTRAPWMEVILEQLAPLLLLGCNAVLPMILRYISTFEGHIAGSALEASLFRKVAIFQVCLLHRGVLLLISGVSHLVFLFAALRLSKLSSSLRFPVVSGRNSITFSEAPRL